MKIEYSIYADSYEDKNKLISALLNSGYIIGAELEKDKSTCRPLGWRVDIYGRVLETKEAFI